MKAKLKPPPVTIDSTWDDLCTTIIGGIIGALCQMTDVETVRRAIQFWASSDSAWLEFQKFKSRP